MDDENNKKGRKGYLFRKSTLENINTSERNEGIDVNIKNCPESKIYNPKTGRCVNKDGTIGRKLMKEKEEKEGKEGKEGKKEKIGKKRKSLKYGVKYGAIFINNEIKRTGEATVEDPDTGINVKMLSKEGVKIIEEYGEEEDIEMLEIARNNEEIMELLNNILMDNGKILELYNKCYEKGIDIFNILNKFVDPKNVLNTLETPLNTDKIDDITPQKLLKIAIYIVNKYKNNKICTIIPNDNIINNIDKLKYIKFSVQVVSRNNKITINTPNGFENKIKECYEKNTEFIFFFLNIADENKDNRLNLIVYNKKDKLLTKIDPLVQNNKLDIYIDENLPIFLGKILLIDKYDTSIVPICPSLSIFDKQVIKSDNLCNIWLLWNLELIMANPFIKLNTLLVNIFQIIYNKDLYSKSFITYVMSYFNSLLIDISSQTSYSVPIHNINRKEIDVLEQLTASFTHFRGTLYYINKGIDYLLKKHHSCTSKLHMRWQCLGSNRQLIIPPNFKNQIEICYNKPVRFIFILLILSDTGSCITPPNNSAHLNALIYDKKYYSLERFEPHGENQDFESYKLDSAIIDSLSSYFPIKNYYTPLSYCPYNNFQVKEEISDKLSSDPGGFCAAWTLWYIDLRLSNPNISRSHIVQYALDYIQNLGSFKNFIRNYSAFISLPALVFS